MERDGEVSGDWRYLVSRFYARLGLSDDTKRLSRANGGRAGWSEREREPEREGGERARERETDLYDGKLQRCLEGRG